MLVDSGSRLLVATEFRGDIFRHKEKRSVQRTLD